MPYNGSLQQQQQQQQQFPGVLTTVPPMMLTVTPQLSVEKLSVGEDEEAKVAQSNSTLVVSIPSFYDPSSPSSPSSSSQEADTFQQDVVLFPNATDKNSTVMWVKVNPALAAAIENLTPGNLTAPASSPAPVVVTRYPVLEESETSGSNAPLVGSGSGPSSVGPEPDSKVSSQPSSVAGSGQPPSEVVSSSTLLLRQKARERRRRQIGGKSRRLD